MRIISLGVISVAMLLSACASQKAAPPERKVPLTAENIVDAQNAGYKIVTENGRTLYCERKLNTGSHLRKTTTCLTAEEWQAANAASRQSVEAMRRDIPPKQERMKPLGN